MLPRYATVAESSEWYLPKSLSVLWAVFRKIYHQNLRRTTYAFPFLPSLVTNAAHLQTPCGFIRYKPIVSDSPCHLFSASLRPHCNCPRTDVQFGSSVGVIPRKDKATPRFGWATGTCLRAYQEPYHEVCGNGSTNEQPSSLRNNVVVTGHLHDSITVFTVTAVMRNWIVS